MRRTLRIAGTVLVLISASGIAQPTKDPHQKDEQAVEDVILALFAGMKAGDSAAVHRTCLDNARLVTSYENKEGLPGTEEITLQDFLVAVGTPHTEKWNEVPESIRVDVQDHLAIAWVPYRFYVDERFSHCGVDAFQLVRTADGWKILNLTDTRRVKACL